MVHQMKSSFFGKSTGKGVPEHGVPAATMAQRTLHCPLTTLQAVTIPILIFPLGRLHAQEIHSALSEERLWLPKGDGEPRRCPLLPQKQRQGTEPPGSWEVGGGHQPRVRRERDSSTSCSGWSCHGQHPEHAAVG